MMDVFKNIYVEHSRDESKTVDLNSEFTLSRRKHDFIELNKASI